MADSPCYKLAKELKATIDARMTGRQVQSSSAKGRSASFADVPLRELIAYYNQVRTSCPEAMADAELIALQPLDQPTGTRGGPAVFYGRSWC